MEELSIDFQNCYGIKKLEHRFDFSKDRTVAIYAPNGVMKTSFTKTFKDFTNNKESKDFVYSKRKTVREIKNESESEVSGNSIFVIESYDSSFESKKMSSLLVNEKLKNQYDDIHKQINALKTPLLVELGKLSGLKGEIEEELSEAFTSTRDNFFKALERIEKEVLDNKEPEFLDISYSKIFNEKILKFLETKDFKNKISAYIEKYNELIGASSYFQKGVFNHNNAFVIAKNLAENGFFEANHFVTLSDKQNAQNKLTSKEDLEKVIEEEKRTILQNPELSKMFEEIDKQLTKNKDLKEFRDYLLNNKIILTELKNLDSFKKKLWISYLKEKKDSYGSLIQEYQSAKETIENIVEEAKKEQWKWEYVIDTFNKRFFVPFEVKLKNQKDVILKDEAPTVSFTFKDSNAEDFVEVEKKTLIDDVLSSGEKRAMYILNLIFEIEGRKESKEETLFVIDDIADSFDYKNKYAIIEYLKEISDDECFSQIILTHNFDFFRTLKNRLGIGYKNCFSATKNSTEIKLKNDNNYFAPFQHFKKSLHNKDKSFISMIPFARNIVEYTESPDSEKYKKLTALLHMKADTLSITKKEVAEIYNQIFSGLKADVENTEPIATMIFTLAEKYMRNTDENSELESKIILSIAIRLRAEEFMITKINNTAKSVSNIPKNQFRQLQKKYTKLTDNSSEHIKLINQVALMTPENIHLNSFMYEPILDMSNLHLKKLYQEVKKESDMANKLLEKQGQASF